MNHYELSIVTLLHYNVIIRDTLEYAMSGRKFTLEAYDYRRKGVLVEIEQNTALKQFIEKNKELGDKVTKEIHELYDTIYGPDSNVCKVAGKELRVDDSQHIAVYDVVLPLHEDIKTIVNAHLSFGRSKNLISDDLMKLVVEDERMYRAVAFAALTRDLNKLFYEYNKARNEAKGEITPQSNFIQGELVKISDHIKNTIRNQSATDVEYWDVVDAINRILEQTAGRRQLPVGRNFNDLFNETNGIVTKFLSATEPKWKELYQAAVDELISLSKKTNGQIKVDIEEDKKKSK